MSSFAPLQRSTPSPTPSAPEVQPAEGESGWGNADRQELLGLGAAPIPFPYLAAIEGALGTPVPGQAVLDPDGCAERGVLAYTEGDVAHFADPDPGRHVAAHEAAHVLQHTGRTGDLGMGPEVHAERFAAAVDAGEDASALLGAAGAVSGAEHPYTVIGLDQQGPASPLGWRNPQGGLLEVSDDGQLALDHVGFGDSQVAWAPASTITSSNATLQSQGSKVRLEAGAADLAGKPPGGGDAVNRLSRVEVKMADGSDPELTDDCGTASHEVMGAKEQIASARIGDGSGGTAYTDPHRYVGGGGGAAPTAAESSFQEVMAREWPDQTPEERYATWGALDEAQRTAFEKKYQVGRYAVPGVGEGITVASLYDTPGWKEQPGQAGKTWNFHYATNIASSGHDYLTLENYAKHGPKNWYFDLLGPAEKGQSFWDAHQDQQGTSSTALVVTPAHDLAVELQNVSETDWWGDPDFVVHASTPTGGSAKSAEVEVGKGKTSTIKLPLASLLPQRASEPITIRITEEDPLSSTEMVKFEWAPPFENAKTVSGPTVTATARMPQ